MGPAGRNHTPISEETLSHGTQTGLLTVSSAKTAAARPGGEAREVVEVDPGQRGDQASRSQPNTSRLLAVSMVNLPIWLRAGSESSMSASCA
jgi:hypothetical protein